MVIADGESPLRMQVELRDRYGNPISGVRPQLSAESGRAELEERGEALYASYVPPLLHEQIRGGCHPLRSDHVGATHSNHRKR